MAYDFPRIIRVQVLYLDYQLSKRATIPFHSVTMRVNHYINAYNIILDCHNWKYWRSCTGESPPPRLAFVHQDSTDLADLHPERYFPIIHSL